MKELESSFDSNTSAMEKNRKKSELLEKSIKNQEKQVEELEKGLEASKKKYGENSTQTQKWKQAVANAKTELNKMKTELNKIPKSLSEVGKSMQSAGKKMKSVGDTMTKYVTAPLTAVGAASIAAYKEVDEAMDSIATATGATGEALTELQDAAKGIATTIPTSFETAADAVATVNTRFGLTGTALDDLSTKFVKFARVNDTDVTSSVEGTQKVMAAFGMETEDAGDLLDAMTKTGQKTGISMDSLQSSMVKNASALSEMGLSAYQAADFLGQVETSGADTSTVMSGLQKALVNAADDGKTLPEALSDFQSIMDSTASDQEKLNAAIDLFGKRAGPAIYQACSEGSLSFKNFSEDASSYLGTVESTFDAVVDPADDFTVTMNNLKALGSDVGKSLLTAAAPAIQTVGNKLKDAADKFSSLSEEEQSFVIYTGVALAAAGPVLSAFGRLTEGVGKVVTAIGEWEGFPTAISSALTNPVGIAALAVGGLIVAFNLLDKTTGYLNEDVQAVVSGTNDAISALDSATSSLSGTLSDAETELGDINDKADLAEDLVSELAELEKQSDLTAEQQGRMRTIVGELNSLYPDLNVQIDSQTGKLSMTTKEIKAYIEQSRKMKLVEAYQKAATKGYEGLAEASIALSDAKNQEADNQEVINGLLEKQAYLYSLVEDENGNLVDASGNFVMAASQLDSELQSVSQDLMHAEENQSALTTATEEAQTVYDDANETIAAYEQAATDTAAELETMTETTEENTEATEANTAATESNASTISDWASQVASGASAAASGLGTAMSAWSELYNSTRDSIEGQIGLFDKWEQDTEITAKQIRDNLHTQVIGMQNYSTNMEKLSAAAAKSSDPNFKAFVQSIAEMGTDAAGEVQALVDAMEGDKTTFNEILGEFGQREIEFDNIAEVETYIANGFKTNVESAMAAVQESMDGVFGDDVLSAAGTALTKFFGGAEKDYEAFGKSAQKSGKTAEKAATDAGATLEKTTKSSTDKAKSYTESEINGMDLEPEVDKVEVPTTVTDLAKQTITNNVSGIHGNVSAVDGTATAGSAAKTKLEKKIDSLSGKVTSVSVSSGALSDIKSTIQGYLNNNPVTARVKGSVSAEYKANGGFVYNEQLTWIAEGDQPEVVIPLSSAKRERALSLYEQTGEALGVATPNHTRMSVGSDKDVAGSVKVQFDMNRLYAAVAAGARQGIENSNMTVFLGEREVGRAMRGMGVQFA